jgi:membrane protease subunit HflK
VRIEGVSPEMERLLRSARPLIGFGVLVLIGLWLLSGVYIVGPDEKGVVQRFGKVVRMTGPGPHYRLPWPFENVHRVRVKQIRRLELGFRTIDPGPPARYRAVPAESIMLTGDEQIVDAQIIVQYQVKDPVLYLFSVRKLEGVGGALKDAAEVALRQVVGQRPIDDVLIHKKEEIEVQIKGLLQKIMDGYNSGIRIVATKLQTVQPPKEVAAAFNDVVSAKEDRERLIKEAQGYKEDIIPKARGKAESIIKEAEAYKQERIKKAEGDASRFLAILREYERARDVTQKRLYLETMEEVLKGVKKIIIDKDVGKNVLQFLPLEGVRKE